MSVLEETVTVLPQLPSDSAIPTALMVDGMAFIQKLRSGGAVNFGDLCIWYYRQLVNMFRRNRCSRIDVIFDTYRKVSIKSGERERRGASSNLLKVTIHSPRQWQKYISSAKNKINRCAFLAEAWCEIGKEKLEEGQILVIGGGFEDNEKVVVVKAEEAVDIAALHSDHEEANTRLLLHAKYTASDYPRTVVQSPDTDVIVLCCSHFLRLVAKNSGSKWVFVINHDTFQFIRSVKRLARVCVFPCLVSMYLLDVTPCHHFTVLAKRKHGMLLRKTVNFKLHWVN